MTDAATMEATPETRTVVLDPTIRQMVQVLRTQSDQPGSLKLAVKQHTVEVGVWERSVILEAFETGTPPSIDLAYRLAEAVAVQARGLNDLVRLTGDAEPGDELQSCTRDDLVLDYAIGAVVSAELTQMMEDFTAGGRRGQARNLADVLGRLQRTLQIIREQLRENEINTADLMVMELKTGAPSQAATGASTADSAAFARRMHDLESPANRRPRGRLAASARQLAIVGVLTAVLVIGGMLLWPTLTEKRDLGEGLRYVPGIDSYAGAPPALKVRVSQIHWSALDKSGKTMWVWGVVAAASRSGYTSCEFLTAEGVAVAKWSKGGRVLLL